MIISVEFQSKFSETSRENSKINFEHSETLKVSHKILEELLFTNKEMFSLKSGKIH